LSQLVFKVNNISIQLYDTKFIAMYTHYTFLKLDGACVN